MNPFAATRPRYSRVPLFVGTGRAFLAGISSSASTLSAIRRHSPTGQCVVRAPSGKTACARPIHVRAASEARQEPCRGPMRPMPGDFGPSQQDSARRSPGYGPRAPAPAWRRPCVPVHPPSTRQASRSPGASPGILMAAPGFAAFLPCCARTKVPANGRFSHKLSTLCGKPVATSDSAPWKQPAGAPGRGLPADTSAKLAS